DLLHPNRIYSLDDEPGGYYDDNSSADEVNRRIYFKLEEPIATGTSNPGKVVYDSYVEPMIRDEIGQRNLYFKAKIKLVNDISKYLTDDQPFKEQIKLN